MHKNQDCRRRVLASGPVARVERCEGCGVLSVHLGAVTVRLEEGACASLVATLQRGLEVIAEAGEATGFEGRLGPRGEA